ncbi:predicted protein [Histoplasma capsulatum G186AR]|uniref:Uncharacterized protein n=1 Tax=Ajellomyces capsulatus (strain G186AR / H82 / ATCC MYA-2454 / RMSCC 2432) TaxID=447093 RepID=C0NU22_AJECG|nr:uncharacterized protein HCBG_06853 [Histoplasma capsulatum G186AR]EEH04902.1 predicted protein [Histoplasma capsulatum G186AR]
MAPGLFTPDVMALIILFAGSDRPGQPGARGEPITANRSRKGLANASKLKIISPSLQDLSHGPWAVASSRAIPSLWVVWSGVEPMGWAPVWPVSKDQRGKQHALLPLLLAEGQENVGLPST